MEIQSESELLFRVTQVALKVVPFLFGMVLLLPLLVLFWNMAKYQPMGQVEFERSMHSILEQEKARMLKDHPDAVGAVGVSISSDVRIGVGPRWLASPWLTYFPRKWVGICGLVATGVLLVLIVISAFVSPAPSVGPASGTWQSHDTAPPETRE